MEFINPFNPGLTSAWVAGAWDATTREGLSRLSQEITRQSAMIAYLNAFGLFTLVAALGIPVSLLAKPRRRSQGWVLHGRSVAPRIGELATEQVPSLHPVAKHHFVDNAVLRRFDRPPAGGAH